MANSLKENTVGLIAYTLTVDGQVVEVVDGEDPIEYLHGAQNIVPGLEKALANKRAGDKLTVTVSPEEGYGEYDPEDYEDVPLDEFDNVEELEVGMEMVMLDEDGEEIEAVIKDITDSYIRLDFNPPFAGKVLHYDVEVVDVRPATEEEIEMGLPESLIDQLYGEYEEDGDD